MKLYHPVTPFKVIQPFGVNGQYYRDHGINILGHNGLDLETTHGQPVYAAHDGDATYIANDPDAGNHVVVINTQMGIRTIYMHLCDPIAEPQFKSPIDNFRINPVKAGDVIGYSNSTGFSTGTHLHFGLKLVNERGEQLNTNNGYGGAINPLPYFDNQTPYLFHTDLYFGLINNEGVRQLQLRLGVIPATGNFGPLTLAAVKKYQLENRIVPTLGYVGSITKASLNKQ